MLISFVTCFSVVRFPVLIGPSLLKEKPHFYDVIVETVKNYTNAKMIAELSENLGEAMVGINEEEIAVLMAERGK